MFNIDILKLFSSGFAHNLLASKFLQSLQVTANQILNLFKYLHLLSRSGIAQLSSPDLQSFRESMFLPYVQWNGWKRERC